MTEQNGVGRSSATDELRAELTRRGVEWWLSDDPCCEYIITHWCVEPFQWTAIEGEKDLWLNAGIAGHEPLTPEQAIAATLGHEVTGETSDGYHTFNELYHHRAVLFSVIVRDHQELAWKSKLHHDGTMYDGMFIVGIETPKGQATYHYDIDPYWDMFDCKELERAPEWDGHTPDDAIERIATLGSTFERRAQGGIMSIIKRLLCRHEYEFVRNIYGGEITVAGYNRSWWRCKKCGKWKLDPHLYLELERKEEDE